MFMNTSNGARSSECLTQADRNSERPSEHYTNLKVENPHHPPIVTEGERVQGGGSGGRGGGGRCKHNYHLATVFFFNKRQAATSPRGRVYGPLF